MSIEDDRDGMYKVPKVMIGKGLMDRPTATGMLLQVDEQEASVLQHFEDHRLVFRAVQAGKVTITSTDPKATAALQRLFGDRVTFDIKKARGR